MALEVIADANGPRRSTRGFKAQAAEIDRVTREQDTHTPFGATGFINEDGTECEVHEMFPDEQGLIEHQMHIMEARTILFRDYAFEYQSTIYSEASRDFTRLVKERIGAAPTTFSFVQGLQQSATI